MYGADEIALRPTYLASDTATDLDWVKHLLDWCENMYGTMPSTIVHLRPTTPLRNEKDIDVALSILSNNSSALRSVERLPEAPEKSFRIDKDMNLMQGIEITKDMRKKWGGEIYNLPNQTFEPAYFGNGLIDIIKTETVLNTKTLHGNKIQAFITPKSVDIDTIEDFEYAEYLINTKGNWIYEFLRRKDYLYFK